MNIIKYILTLSIFFLCASCTRDNTQSMSNTANDVKNVEVLDVYGSNKKALQKEDIPKEDIQNNNLKLPTKSQFSSLSQTLGVSDIMIYYYRPNVNGRKIWGELVKYNSLWISGAEKSTKFHFDDDVTINGNKLTKGDYSFFTRPKNTSKWTIIFNKNHNIHGVQQYDSTLNALQLDVDSRSVPFTETLTYEIANVEPLKAKVILKWADKAIDFNIELNKEVVWNKITDYLLSIEGEDSEIKWKSYVDIANFTVFSLEKDKADFALQLIEESLEIREVFENLRLKSDLLALKGDYSSAIKWAIKAHEFGSKSGIPLEAANQLEANIKKYKELISQQ